MVERDWIVDQWLVTGDAHGEFGRFKAVQELAASYNEQWGIIILGDAGINFWLSKRDKRLKKQITRNFPNLWFYCLRGNHEERPENIKTMVEQYDHEVSGHVYLETAYPHIRYLIDGEEYFFGDQKAIAIGGAYSVDKWWRLEQQAQGAYAGWFSDEQLDLEERELIAEKVKGQHYDLVLTHTCPWEWQPRDLFLSSVDQTTVDDSMERWLGEIKETFEWEQWVCGHYHDDRYLAPGATMLSTSIKPLN